MLVPISPSAASDDTFFFVENTIDQNIIYDQIEDILIDSDGFIWIATPTGLHYFDGYAYHTFLHDAEDSTSIAENFITTLFEDRSGKIWIGTFNNGINIYDKRTKAFENLTNDKSSVNSIARNKSPRMSKVMVQDNDGYVIARTGTVLNRIDTSNGHVVRHPVPFQGQLIYESDQDLIWMTGEGLGKYAKGNFELETSPQNEWFSEIFEIVKTYNGDLILGTDRGAYLYQISNSNLVPLHQYFDVPQANLPQGSIHGLYIDMNGNVWMGSERHIFSLNVSTKSISKISYQENLTNGLLDERIKGIYGNGRGRVFISYESRGVTSLKIRANRFEHIGGNEVATSGAKLKNVRAVFQDKQENLWLGTYHYGLFKIGSDGGEKSNYQFDPDVEQSISSNFITAIHKDSRERLWVGSFEDGYTYSDPFYSGDPVFHRGKFSGLEIHEFLEIENGRILMATNNGLLIHDLLLDSAWLYGQSAGEASDLSTINIQSMHFEAPNTLWFASWNKGVGKLIFGAENQDDELIIYEDFVDENDQLLDHRLINLCKGEEGVFWLASSANGLIKMNTKSTINFQKYDVSTGAPSNTIYSIVADDQQSLWLSTANGMGRFDLKEEKFYNYHKSDGLLSNTFIWDAYYQNDQGQIFFGAINGVTLFHPDSVSRQERNIHAYLSGFYVNHAEINVGQNVNDRVILNENIRYTSELILTHQEVNFSLEFAALNIENPTEVKFSYMLEGQDESWVTASSASRLATYTNLNPGDYIFKVRASRNVGRWGEPSVLLHIKVLPPWWQTIWAYLIYILLVVAILILIQRELIQRAVLRQRLKMEEYKHDRDNELNQEKFKFFTNLSHELRTPLTLILGPLSRMIDKKEVNNRVRQNLLVMQKQAFRLQKLTNQLMDFRKYEIDNLKLKSAEGNVVQFIDEIVVAFRQHAKIKQVNFEYSKSLDDLKLFYDRDKLEIVLVNLLSNAFKFTPPEGHISLAVETKSRSEALLVMEESEQIPNTTFGELDSFTKNVVEISVKDSGVGIAQDQLSHIFDRYFQASNIQSISIGGTGIGLEITKNYIELHHGSILAQSEVGIGTTFTFWLPLGGAHLNHDEIIPDFKSSEHEDHYKNFKGSLPDSADYQIDYTKPVDINKELPVLLIVDDNPDIIYFLKQSFETQFNILIAQNGKKGLELALEYLPDLIISDIMMPEVDGLEFCHQVKTDVRSSHIPVILLTARTANVFEMEGLENGADDYITKPFDEKLLHLRVRNLIESRKKLRERYSHETALLPADLTITKPDEEFLSQIIRLVEENISSNDFSVEWLAREIGMSHSVLYKKISALTDLTVVEFIRSIRLKKAASLMKQTDLKMNQISAKVGFTDSKYFSKSFQKFYGQTPSDYKKSN